MNEDQRKIINSLTVDLSHMLEKIYAVKSLEHEEFDSMDKALQEGEVGYNIQQTINELENSEDTIHHLIDTLSKAVGNHP